MAERYFKTAAAPSVGNGINKTVTDAGDTIAYTFNVANTGNVTLLAIAVTDAKIANITCPYVGLLPATNMDCTATYTITQADLDTGGVTNTATVNGTTPGGTDTVSPLANVTSGWRKVAAPGNVGHCFSTFYRFPPGTYYWSMQAVDGGFKGGAWAAELSPQRAVRAAVSAFKRARCSCASVSSPNAL